jgi:hypothetical protein
MVWRLGRSGASRSNSGGGGGRWRAGGRGREPRGVRLGGQVCPMRCRCGAVEAALLRPGRAAHAVTLKARQHARVLCDLQWEKFCGCLDVKRTNDGRRDAV